MDLELEATSKSGNEETLEGREDVEVSADGNSSLQIDAVSSMQVSMECESSVEHKRKRHHRESECI